MRKSSLRRADVAVFAEADLPAQLRKQVLRLHRDAWPELRPGGHDPALRPVSMLILHEGRVISALDVLSKEIAHRGELYAASGLSAVVTDSAYRRRGFGHRLVLAAREEIRRRGSDLALFTCDLPLQRFYERAGWKTLPGTVLIGGTPENPLPSDRAGKITLGYLYSARALHNAPAFIGARIGLYPGAIDKLW